MVTWTARAERLDDGALLAAMALGDAGSATVFVRRYQRPVYGLAVTMCHDGRLAEDLAQQTFERVWRHAGSYDARRATVRTWVLTITRRLCIDALRAQRSTPLDPERMLALIGAERESVEDRALDRVEIHRMRAAIELLSAEQRRAVLLASMGGHTAAEIAVLEQIPLGTAKTRLRQGLQRLRSQLTAEPTDQLDRRDV